MTFKFGVIGAGWYGCHIASSFKSLGFDVSVFEAQDDLMTRASGNNQFRLHQGFHYARNYRTRLQSRDGYMRFLERYPHLSEPVENNLYAVPDNDSLLDFPTYRLIMTSSGIEFWEAPVQDYGLNGCGGVLLSKERVLLTERARNFFRRKLGCTLRLSTPVTSLEVNDSSVHINGEKFDYVVDATWGGFSSIDLPVHYEPTLLLYYRSDISSFALTLVDGELCSIYPTETKGLFTLSSVTHTPLGSFPSMRDARARLECVTELEVEEKRQLMEKQILSYYPGFLDSFSYEGPQFSIKTKLLGAADDRSCYVSKHGRKFIVMSGKIDTIFYATETILSMVESENDVELERN